MDTLLSAAREMNEKIMAAQGQIETIQMMVDAIEKSTLCYLSPDGVPITLIEHLSEDEMTVIKGYVYGFLYEKVEEPKRWLESILGFEPLDDVVEEEEEMKTPNCGKVKDSDMEKAVAEGWTAAKLAETYGIKESTAKHYLHSYKRNGTILQTKKAKAEAKVKAEVRKAEKPKAEVKPRRLP